MKACQLCGAKSWGKVAAGMCCTYSMRIVAVTDEDYVACDNCGAWALRNQVEEVGPIDTSRPLPGLITPDPLSMAGDMLKKFLPSPPKPETCLERLLRAALSSPISRRPEDLVNYVLKCEDLLIAAEKGDAPGIKESGDAWLTLSWGTKENFTDWLWLRLTSLDGGPIEKLLSSEMKAIAMAVAESVSS
jgi:hypothetical protein